MSDFEIALKEIGDIKPWWSEDDQLYVFEHALYPMVDYAAKTPEETIKGYKIILSDFIKDRLAGNVSEITERLTSGRGGARPNAGRPKLPVERKRVYVDADIAEWLKAPENISSVRHLMTKPKRRPI